MNPELQKKLQEERQSMDPEMRQAVALERISDLMQAMNGHLTSISHQLGAISRRG